jgi:hypothetical protein
MGHPHLNVYSSTTIRKTLTAMLVLAITSWAEAGLALVAGDQAMQCSMTMQQMQAMGSMTCCPDGDAHVPALSKERPQCCSVSQTPERPLGFVVNSERAISHTLDLAAVLPADSAASAAQHFGIWRSADAPRFIKPVLELKTDLRI